MMYAWQSSDTIVNDVSKSSDFSRLSGISSVMLSSISILYDRKNNDNNSNNNCSSSVLGRIT